MWLDDVLKPGFEEKIPQCIEGYGYHLGGLVDHNSDFNLMLDYIKQNKKAVNVEAGCYDGSSAYRISKRFPRIVGIDILPEHIKYARSKYPKMPFLLADFYLADEIFEEESIDTFFMLNNIAYDIFTNNNADWFIEPMKHINKVIKPNGKAVFRMGAWFQVYQKTNLGYVELTDYKDLWLNRIVLDIMKKV